MCVIVVSNGQLASAVDIESCEKGLVVIDGTLHIVFEANTKPFPKSVYDYRGGRARKNIILTSRGFS